MQNKWNKLDSIKYINYYNKKKISKDLALRIYTTHLLGREKDLVLHGGGNTSLKATFNDIFKNNINVMHIKGSGWDMSSIDFPGMPAVELDPLLKTKLLSKLNDFDMTNLLRKYLIDLNSPNPSVETLLHAFLPFKYIDHTHANAILGLIDQPNDFKICEDTFGNKVGIVPYVIPGFKLAKLSYDVFCKNKNVIGLILLKHGIFTFGDTAKESYTRMIKLVSIAENVLVKNEKKIFIGATIKKKKLNNIDPSIFSLIRKHLYYGDNNNSLGKWIIELRSTNKILKYLEHPELKSFSQRGPVTPDHVIRIKPKPLLLNASNLDESQLAKLIKIEFRKFRQNYHRYFLKYKKLVEKPIELDNNPRLILTPGLGIIGIGRTKKEAKISLDLAEATVDIVSKAESFGKFQSIPNKEIFKMEYWPLEQAKLKNVKRKELTGNVTVISGGCGAIGLATAKEFYKSGSEVVLLENDIVNIKNTPLDIKQNVKIIKCDVTNKADIKKSFLEIKKTFGGMDILVSNAGAPWQGDIGKVSEKIIKESFELNFFAHQYLSQAAVQTMLKQETGGVLLYNISKQSINPGKNFGPYGLPKASTLFLMRQYTLEYSKFGIRANGVNADRIRSGIVNSDFIASRAKARNISQKEYMEGNLLEAEVLAEDVAKAFLVLAKAKKTTGDVMTVDGGNITAVLR